MEAGVIREGVPLPSDACAACGSPLAGDQRYCLNCGKRVGILRVPGSQVVSDTTPSRRQPARPLTSLFRMPAPRSAGAVAALTLAFGVFIGLAMSPAFQNVGLGFGRLVLQLPQSIGGGGSGGSGAEGDVSAELGSPLDNVGGGGGSGAGPAAGPTGQVPTSSPAPSPAPAPTAPGAPAKGPGPIHHAPPLPPAPNQNTIAGTVVHVNPVAKSYSLATTTGDLVPVHTTDLPDPRTNVSVDVDQLFNGTFAERGERSVAGTSDDATFGGTVTHVDQAADAYTVSVRGASVLVHGPPGADPQLPPLANEVSVTVGIELPQGSARSAGSSARSSKAEARGSKRRFSHGRLAARAKRADGCAGQPIPGPEPSAVLRQQSVIIQGPPIGSIGLEGIVERACPSSRELSLSADDIRESNTDIRIAPPPTIDLSRLTVGEAVDATLAIGGDGSYTLTGIASDDGEEGADDPGAGQGDLAPG
jgi:hypothetical protein